MLFRSLSAIAIAVLGLASLHLDHRVDAAAGRAALEQYRQRTGMNAVSVGWTVRYGDCAVVALQDFAHQGVASIAMKRVDSIWTTGRSTEEEEVSFDSDDVGSESDCLDVANSAGPLTNGRPPS